MNGMDKVVEKIAAIMLAAAVASIPSCSEIGY